LMLAASPLPMTQIIAEGSDTVNTKTPVL